MNKKYIVLLIKGCYLWLIWSNCMGDENNMMIKIVHHKGFVTDKLSCYFKGAPVCNVLSDCEDTKKGWMVKKFLLPMTCIDAEVKRTVDQINKLKNNYYKVEFRFVSKPMKAVEVLVHYSPDKIAFQIETGNFINDKKSINFQFHHKDNLDNLKQKTDELFKFAYCDNIQHGCAKPKIVVDCGHGAHDPGAIGLCGTVEKDIALCIGKKLVYQLESNGFNVYMTRKDDTFYSLGERTSFANAHKADLFLSLHANASSNQEASGIETYWSAHKNFMQVCSTVQEQDRNVLYQLSSSRSAVSKRCAQQIQKSLIEHCRPLFPVVNRGDREVELQVLFGTEMPAILVEVAFLTNQEEARMVQNEKYQNALVSGIFSGICHHFNIIS